MSTRKTGIHLRQPYGDERDKMGEAFPKRRAGMAPGGLAYCPLEETAFRQMPTSSHQPGNMPSNQLSSPRSKFPSTHKMLPKRLLHLRTKHLNESTTIVCHVLWLPTGQAPKTTGVELPRIMGFKSPPFPDCWPAGDQVHHRYQRALASGHRLSPQAPPWAG